MAEGVEDVDVVADPDEVDDAEVLGEDSVANSVLSLPVSETPRISNRFVHRQTYS